MAVVTTAGAGLVSLIPHPPSLPGPFSGDQDLHAIAYMVMTGIWLQATRARRWPITLAALLALGVALEAIQILSPVRFFQWTDMLANLVGVLAGGALCLTPAGYIVGLMDRCLTRLATTRP